MKQFILGIILIMLLPLKSYAVTVTLALEDASTSIFIGDIFTVNIFADIPEPVLGWGLDINFDSSLVNQTAPPVIGPSWLAASSLDGDGLAGLAFPTPVSGNSILLASLSFEAMAEGTALFSAGITPFDLTEGFPLAFALPGSFAEVVFVDEVVNISVPEPGTLLLLIIGLAGLINYSKMTGKRYHLKHCA